MVITDYLCIHHIMQFDAKLKIQSLTVSFTIMNNFGDMIRLKCGLTSLNEFFSTLNSIN